MSDIGGPTSQGEPGDPTTLFDRVGGSDFFDALVDRFYEGVAADPLLRPMYPRELGPAIRRFAMFLQQYWGGPTTYSEERGHPRLRMRHAPFVVDDDSRAAWLAAMASALDEAAPNGGVLHPADRELFDNYFNMASEHLLNA